MMRSILSSIVIIILSGCATTYTGQEEYYYSTYRPNTPIYYPSLYKSYQNPMFYDYYFGGLLSPGAFFDGNEGYNDYYYSRYYRYDHGFGYGGRHYQYHR